ncbi:MAG: hypothetical protein M0C28_46935 [Candidatus Moduliflexus flocculans]|nr:hypothetical protein [Candidatus Moduliflexus flocculans]
MRLELPAAADGLPGGRRLRVHRASSRASSSRTSSGCPRPSWRASASGPGLPWALKMPIGHLVDLFWQRKSFFVYFGALLMAAGLLIMVGLTGLPRVDGGHPAAGRLVRRLRAGVARSASSSRTWWPTP